MDTYIFGWSVSYSRQEGMWYGVSPDGRRVVRAPTRRKLEIMIREHCEN